MLDDRLTRKLQSAKVMHLFIGSSVYKLHFSACFYYVCSLSFESLSQNTAFIMTDKGEQ
jgi:hypothetical protein